MHTRADSCTYVGRLEAGSQAVYVVDSDGVERLSPRRGGFAWGTDAAGAARELARTLLTDASGFDPGAETCSRFSAQILSRLPHDGFALPRGTVSAWLRRVVPV